MLIFLLVELYSKHWRRSVSKNGVSPLPPYLPSLGPPPLHPAGFERSPTVKRFYDAVWAENHSFGDIKSTINHLFVSQWNSELTLYANKQMFYGIELLIIWLNFGCPAITGQPLGQMLGVWTTRQPRPPPMIQSCTGYLGRRCVACVIVGLVWRSRDAAVDSDAEPDVGCCVLPAAERRQTATSLDACCQRSHLCCWYRSDVCDSIFPRYSLSAGWCIVGPNTAQCCIIDQVKAAYLLLLLTPQASATAGYRSTVVCCSHACIVMLMLSITITRSSLKQ